MAHDKPQPCKVPALDRCQKRFLWTIKGVNLVQHPAVGLVLQAGDLEKLPQAPCLKSLGLFLILNKQASCLKSQGLFLILNKQASCLAGMEEDGDDKRFVQLELACEADGVVQSPNPL